jgi:hypothetical protein
MPTIKICLKICNNKMEEKEHKVLTQQTVKRDKKVVRKILWIFPTAILIKENKGKSLEKSIGNIHY